MKHQWITTMNTTGDVDEALELVHRSDGIARAKDVAAVQAEKAMSAVLSLEKSPAREALIRLAHKIVNRNHWFRPNDDDACVCGSVCLWVFLCHWLSWLFWTTVCTYLDVHVGRIRGVTADRNITRYWRLLFLLIMRGNGLFAVSFGCGQDRNQDQNQDRKQILVRTPYLVNFLSMALVTCLPLLVRNTGVMFAGWYRGRTRYSIETIDWLFCDLFLFFIDGYFVASCVRWWTFRDCE